MWSLISIEFFVISAIVFGFLGRYIAKQKNRSGAEGFWFKSRKIHHLEDVTIVSTTKYKKEILETALTNLS
jgi:hypothetical protein